MKLDFLLGIISGLIGLFCWGLYFICQPKLGAGIEAVVVYLGVMMLVPTGFFLYSAYSAAHNKCR